MQLADNEALARALESGQTQEVSFTLMFDWQRDGKYDTAFADFSDVVVEATLDAQFTGNYPTELEVNDGYAQRQLSVTVQGEVAGINVVTLFSPFSGTYFGQIGAINTPCYFDVTYMTDEGPVDIRQFTGYVILAQPSRKDGTVELTLADITSQLTAEAKLLPSARSQIVATYNGQADNSINTAVQQRGGSLLSWYMIHLLRQNGMYQGPKPPKNCLAYFTLAGGPLPEVGTLNQMPRDGRQCWPVNYNGDSVVMSAFWQSYWDTPMYRRFPYDPTGSSMRHMIRDGGTDDAPTFYVAESTELTGSAVATDVDTPETDPGELWENGPYGPVMKYLPNPPVSDNAEGFLQGDARNIHLNSLTSEGFNPHPSSSATRNRLYFGGWQYFDWPNMGDAVHTMDYAQTNLQVYLTGQAAFHESLRPNPYPSSSTSYNVTWPNHAEAYAFFSVYVSDTSLTGAINAAIVNVAADAPQGLGTQTVYRQQLPNPGRLDGWHYVGACIEFGQNNVPVFTFNIDGKEYAGADSDVSDPIGNYNTSDLGIYNTVPKEDKTSTRTVETSVATLITSGMSSHWGSWYEYGVAPSAAKYWSNAADCMDYEVTTNVGTSMARVLWTPDTRGKAAWDVLKEIGSADLGVIYTDEYGKVYYKNRDDIRALEGSDSIASTLSLDEVQDVNPYTTFDSIRNRVSFTSQDKYFVDTAVFKSQNPNDFAVGGGPAGNGNVGVYYLTVDDAMSVLPGLVTPRRLAQGYWSPTPGSLDNPMKTWLPTNDSQYGPQFTYKDFMDSYGPDFWKNGFEAHNAGDKTTAGQPLEGANVLVRVAIGWDETDDDPRHITVYFYDDGGRLTTLSVDDDTAFLNIRGFQITDAGSSTATVYANDTSSVQHFGERLLERSQSDWTSDYQTQLKVSQTLVDDLSSPRPVFDSLDVIGDPRRQLQDVVQVVDANTYGSIGGPIYGAVIGINRKYSVDDGVSETLTLRQIKNRGGAWVLGSDSFSQLGQTTILG